MFCSGTATVQVKSIVSTHGLQTQNTHIKNVFAATTGADAAEAMPIVCSAQWTDLTVDLGGGRPFSLTCYGLAQLACAGCSVAR